jgi:O-antigen/teichoic acid export membrane protein
VRRQTSIGQEILWLLIFLVLFGLVAALALNYAAPHRFNDRIAIALAAIFAGAIMIALRARFVGRNARRP